VHVCPFGAVGDETPKYHAVVEEGVPYRDIAETIGQGLKVPVVSVTPEKTADYFGALAWAMAWDFPASSKRSRAKLGWNATGPGLLTDLERRFR